MAGKRSERTRSMDGKEKEQREIQAGNDSQWRLGVILAGSERGKG